MVALTAGQRRSPIGDADRVGAVHPAAVPQIPLAPSQRRRAAGHQNLVCRLRLIAAIRLEPPAKPRPPVVDAQRIDREVAAQSDRPDPEALYNRRIRIIGL